MDFPLSLASWRTGLAAGFLAGLLAWETFQPFFSFFPRPADRVRHGARNLALGLFNALIVGLIFSGLWLTTTRWDAAHQAGLLNWLQLPAPARLVVAVLLLDGWMYAWHRLNHRVPLLWRFHRLHHADRAMDVTSASRFHTVEIVLSSLLRIPVLLLIGCTVTELALYELMLFAIVQFHHANIALPERLDRILRQFIVTPSIHKVHHSDRREETDSNFSSLFSWWDRLARTQRRSAHPKQIVFGLKD